MNAIHRLTQYCLSLALAGACALPSRAAEGPAAAPPAGWEDCEVAEYREETAPAGARATAGDKVERWVLRSSRVPGAVYAVKRTVRGRKEISMCAYSPNRVLATLGPGQDYASFVEAMAAKGLKVVRLLMEDLDGNPVYVVESENTETDLVDQMTMSIEETGMCGAVAPDHIYEAEAVPNDPDWAAQWGLEKIGAPQAWETRTDASSVLVAVLDTGINHDHFDLNRNLWTNPGEIPGDGVDNDGNGIVDDVFGVACIGGNAGAATMDDNGHGTHCAGIIGEVGNNWRNGAGVAWSAKIMSLKFLNGEGRGAVSDAITCLRYAAEQGVRVVNCSFGSADWDDYLFAQMVKMGKAGTVFACAAGNARNGQPPRDNDVFPFYPANFQVDNLVAVAASDPEDRLANFSYYGAANVDIAAPGTDIRSTVLGTYGMDAKSGTSMATPHVAGALALLMAEYPEEDAGRITERLYAAAEPVAALAGKVRTGARLSMAGFFGIAPPTEVSATQGTVQDAVVLYWTAAKDATHYRVWRADSEDGEKTMLCDWRQGLTYGDTEAEPGVTNWYFLQAARSASGDKASVFSAGVPGFRPAPDDRHVTVSFDAAGGTVERTSALYEIGAPYGSFPAAQRDGMAFLGWHTAAEGGARVDESCVADADTTALHAHWIDGDALRVERLFARQRYPWNGLVDVTFELAGVPAGEFASVALEAAWTGEGGDGGEAAAPPLATWEAGVPEWLGNGEHHGVWNADADAGAGASGVMSLRATASVEIPAPPAEGRAEDDPAASAIDLSWSAAKGATGYVVSRGTTDVRTDAEEAATVSETSWRDEGGTPGTVYHYWVQSRSSGGTSEGALHLSARRGLIPVAVEIGGPDAVDAGTTVQYSATAVLNDGSRVAATDAASWSMASGGGLAAFVGNGLLVAAGSATGGSVTLRAAFATNGVSASAEKTVAVQPVAVRVAFDGNGGTADPESGTYTAYGAYGTLASAKRTGYGFAGWFTEANGGSRVWAESTVPAVETTLYAHWTTNTYMVGFQGNGGSGELGMTEIFQTMTYDTPVALQRNRFTLANHAFLGWSASEDGDVEWADGAVVTNLSAEAGAVLRMYAVWLGPPATVTASDATSADAVTVTWAAAVHAESYEVWRGTTAESGDAARLAAGVTEMAYEDTTAVPGTVYRYWVKSVRGGVASGFGSSDEGRRMMGTPVLKATIENALQQVILTWTPVEGAVQYEVWRASFTQTDCCTITPTAGNAPVATLAGNATTWTDAPDMVGNMFHQYRVRAIGGADTGGFSKYGEVRTYRNPGVYALSLPAGGAIQVNAVGAGGGGGFCADPTITYAFLAGGGSGGAFQGQLSLAAGDYAVTVGAGGAGAGSVWVTAATGGAGGATMLDKDGSTVFSVGGGGGGAANWSNNQPGAGGAAAGGAILPGTVLVNISGAPGGTNWQTTQTIAYAAGGGSVFYGLGEGGGSGGGGTSRAGAGGFFQIAFSE